LKVSSKAGAILFALLLNENQETGSCNGRERKKVIGFPSFCQELTLALIAPGQRKWRMPNWNRFSLFKLWSIPIRGYLRESIDRPIVLKLGDSRFNGEES